MKTERKRLPSWFKIKLDRNGDFNEIEKLIDHHNLNTVCRGARCPNIWECWNCGTATFMILGERCTRGCAFCSVPDICSPAEPDKNEPKLLAEAVARMKLKWVVITSVTRDDLPDGGAAQFAECVSQVRKLNPDTALELLIPDLKGDKGSLEIVIESKPEVLAHNVETVPALYPEVRPQADYRRSLGVLEYIKKSDPEITTKSSIMVGLGETEEQVREVFADLVSVGCNVATVGQYLPPGSNHPHPSRFYTPEEFERLAKLGQDAGIEKVFAGPLVRSSYRAHELAGRELK